MRQKRRYILAYVDADLYGDGYRRLIKAIRDAYGERFGKEELDSARVSLVYGRGGRRRKGMERGRYSVRTKAGADVRAGMEEDEEESERGHDGAYGGSGEHAGGMLPVIIRCSLEHYSHVMHVLSLLGIRTVTTSGTLKALHRRRGKARIISGRGSSVDGDEVRAAPG
ncbi:MAG: hypothetical protein RMJ59_05100 [Candidatus Nitrosocaldus sp.]|nr:Rpp14/Pop5 family protein [Candidatus Nitrosocaldus sp.]MDW8275740.1 hypothetical protein [Candidatus Nitrosocaldus sp.]